MSKLKMKVFERDSVHAVSKAKFIDLLRVPCSLQMSEADCTFLFFKLKPLLVFYSLSVSAKDRGWQSLTSQLGQQ